MSDRSDVLVSCAMVSYDSPFAATREETSELIAENSNTFESTVQSTGLHESIRELSKLGKAHLLRECIFGQKEALKKAKKGSGEERVKLGGGEIRQMLERIQREGNAPQIIRDFEASLKLSDGALKELVEELGKLVRGRIYREYVRGTLRVSASIVRMT